MITRSEQTQMAGMVPLGLSGAEVIATLFPGITFAELKVKVLHTSELH